MQSIQYADDALLAYASSRRVFEPGKPLLFDEAYRLAHLLLVDAGSSSAIPSKPGTDYEMGRYTQSRYSVVVPIRHDSLATSAAFLTMEAELRGASFSRKIAWWLCDQRKDKLHATLISGVRAGDITAHEHALRTAMVEFAPMAFEIRGLFLGNINTGRMYLPVYPRLVGSEDSFTLLQRACGARLTRFFAVGYYNLSEELDVDECAELAAMVNRWKSTVLDRQLAKSVWIMQTNDDLVLSGRVISTVNQDG